MANYRERERERERESETGGQGKNMSVAASKERDGLDGEERGGEIQEELR